jgi:hypothetical protein
MTILRSGSNERYSANWAKAFGESKSSGHAKTKKPMTAKNATKPKAKATSKKRSPKRG